MADRIGFLEGEVERLSQDLANLEEESRFLHQLLDERPGGAGELPPGDPES